METTLGASRIRLRLARYGSEGKEGSSHDGTTNDDDDDDERDDNCLLLLLKFNISSGSDLMRIEGTAIFVDVSFVRGVVFEVDGLFTSPRVSLDFEKSMATFWWRRRNDDGSDPMSLRLLDGWLSPIPYPIPPSLIREGERIATY